MAASTWLPAWNLFRWLPFGPELLKFVFAKFVEQDRRTMELQSEGLKHNPHLMLIRRRRPSRKMVFPIERQPISKPSAPGAR